MVLLLYGIYKNLTHRNFYSRKNYKILKNYIIGFKRHHHRKISFLKDTNIEEGSETTLRSLHWWIQVMIHWSKPREGVAPSVNPDVNYGLKVILCVSIDSSVVTCAIPVADIDNG